MPITITTYQCKICNESFDTLERAQRCENLGVPKNILPPGTAYEYGLHGDGVLLVIARHEVVGHSIGYSMWGFRDNGSGDNGPGEIAHDYPGSKNGYVGMCGGSGPRTPVEKDEIAKPNSPRFYRAAAALKKIGIKIMPWGVK
jgi:hypothetical protein